MGTLTSGFEMNGHIDEWLLKRCVNGHIDEWFLT